MCLEWWDVIWYYLWLIDHWLELNLWMYMSDLYVWMYDVLLSERNWNCKRGDVEGWCSMQQWWWWWFVDRQKVESLREVMLRVEKIMKLKIGVDDHKVRRTLLVALSPYRNIPHNIVLFVFVVLSLTPLTLSPPLPPPLHHYYL